MTKNSATNAGRVAKPASAAAARRATAASNGRTAAPARRATAKR
ncbi:hypothetical protein AB0368_23930 [Actinoplanes sp. NPDC051475]